MYFEKFLIKNLPVNSFSERSQRIKFASKEERSSAELEQRKSFRVKIWTVKKISKFYSVDEVMLQN